MNIVLGIIVLGVVLFIIGILVYVFFQLLRLSFLIVRKNVLRFKCFILNVKSKHLDKKLAKLYYENVQLSCKLMPYIRKQYFETHFLTEDKIKKQKELEEEYNNCIKTLNDPKSETYMNYLSDEEKENLKKLLQAPRYELH